MSYKQIRPLAFQFASKDELPCDYYTLEFPEKWKTILQDLQTSATSRNSHPTSIPISTLNKALRSLVPDLISIARNAHHSGSRPWLYSRQEIDKAVLFLIVKAWVKTNFKANEQNPDLALEKMSADDLQWEKQEQVNLAHEKLAGNGTAEWQDKFILLADEIAARISDKFKFECDDSLLKFGPKEELKFRRASLATDGRGAELISWPPFCYERKKKRWYYSALLTITVQTVPFQSFPVIYIDVGVRRWCGEKISDHLPSGKDTSVYLLTSVPWIKGLTESHSFSVAPIRYRKSGYGWGSKLGDLLNKLQPTREFPKPSEIINNPETALNINDDNLPSAAVVFRYGIKPQHDVDSGVMPGERSLFLEQIAEILKPDFKLTELLDRVNFSLHKRQNPFAEKTEREDKEAENKAKTKKKEPKPPKKEPKKPEDYATLRSQRRHAIGKTVNNQLTVEIWYQSETVRDDLINAVGDYMGIYAGIEENPPSLPHTWKTPELTLTMHVEQLGEIGAELEINTNKSNITDRLHEAIRNRCKQIEKRIPLASGATVALIELGGKSSFDDNADPKYALRLGFATRGRLTQVIDRDADSENLSNRAKSAVLDALRQLGVWPLQSCEESNKVQQLNLFESNSKPQSQPCVGLWMIKHYSRSSPTRVAYFLPVMVYLEWYTGKIYAIAPGFDGWLPYREALLAIALVKAEGYKDQKQATNWIQQTIGENLPENTLLICHAQNLRGQAWTWLKNPNLTRDSLAFGNETPTPISNFKGLRIVRVRDDGGHETPEWYALDGDEKGFSEGIFSISERVFASTGQKPVQQSNLNKNLAKFSRREAKGKDGQIQDRDPQPNKPAWNPQMIEIAVACIQKDDKPEHWAALVHELRQVVLQYQGRTQLPFPLHLASKMEEYTLPVEDENE